MGPELATEVASPFRRRGRSVSSEQGVCIEDELALNNEGYAPRAHIAMARHIMPAAAPRRTSTRRGCFCSR